MVGLREDGLTKNFLLVFAVALLSLFMKLLFSFYVIGTNDILSNRTISHIIQSCGTFKLYEYFIDGCYYNHPPLTLWLLVFVSLMERFTVLSFPYLFRLIPIIADFLSIFVIWGLLNIYEERSKIVICLACVLSPINFFVSAFHGSNDAILIFLILLSIYFMEKKNHRIAGLFFGLSLCIKIVPIILIPLFVFYPRIRKEKLRFIGYAACFPLLVFVPYLAKEYHQIVRGVFSYKSLVGIWGITSFLKGIYTNPSIHENLRTAAYKIFQWQVIYFRFYFLILVAVASRYFIDKKGINLTEGVFFIFCLFFVLTPGFGVQYLVWLSFFSLVVSLPLGILYALLGGFFLYRVYLFWGAWVPPFFANSWRYGQWSGFERTLDIALWCMMVLMLTKFIVDISRRQENTKRSLKKPFERRYTQM